VLSISKTDGVQSAPKRIIARYGCEIRCFSEVYEPSTFSRETCNCSALNAFMTCGSEVFPSRSI
jgi:hypothetical protein